MKKNAGYLVALLLGLIIGFFAGREHLKNEMRSALLESISSALAGSESNDRQAGSGKTVQADEDQEHATEAAYIEDFLELYDVSATYRDSTADSRVPGVLFKLRNSGERSLDRVEVTIYFKDSGGGVIAEESFRPVLASEYFSANTTLPLRPGDMWEMEPGKFYAAKEAPTEWQEGSIGASITDIRFTE